VVGRLAISSKTIGAMGGEPVPAAQYVRMSTEHQRYSTEHQSDAILQYAVRYGFDIVRTYADNGKSGLRLDGRDALKQLLIDVEGGSPGFKAVLVYDVSRWGRFQDADESAYYEYVCRRSGVEIRYCAEQFENDGSAASTIVKTVKRAMAGEYSRELSAKVFAGQCRLIELGFRQGGHAGYGLRRRLVDQNGNPKAILAFGEQKSLQTDRVVLEPGPVEEVETVRRMFRMFVYEEKHQREIAAILNKEQIRTDLGRRWTAGSVQQVLTNEKYIGNNVFNRASAKLTNKRIANPPEMWVRAIGAFPAIVDPELFRAARAVLAMRNRQLSDDEMLALLKDLYVKHGPVVDHHRSIQGFAGQPDLPSAVRKSRTRLPACRVCAATHKQIDRDQPHTASPACRFVSRYHHQDRTAGRLGRARQPEGPDHDQRRIHRLDRHRPLPEHARRRRDALEPAARYGSAARYHDRRAPVARQ
jgi:DNA invertase Pin-like site-specific DNA recombinase